MGKQKKEKSKMKKAAARQAAEAETRRTTILRAANGVANPLEGVPPEVLSFPIKGEGSAEEPKMMTITASTWRALDRPTKTAVQSLLESNMEVGPRGQRETLAIWRQHHDHIIHSFN